MNNYDYSANISQAIVAFAEAAILFDGKITKNAMFAAIIFISTFVPPSGIFNMYGANEKLMETAIATILSSVVITPIWDGGFGRNAMKGFILSTSSMGFTNQLYNLYF